MLLTYIKFMKCSENWWLPEDIYQKLFDIENIHFVYVAQCDRRSAFEDGGRGNTATTSMEHSFWAQTHSTQKTKDKTYGMIPLWTAIYVVWKSCVLMPLFRVYNFARFQNRYLDRLFCIAPLLSLCAASLLSHRLQRHQFAYTLSERKIAFNGNAEELKTKWAATRQHKHGLKTAFIDVRLMS